VLLNTFDLKKPLELVLPSFKYRIKAFSEEEELSEPEPYAMKDQDVILTCDDAPIKRDWPAKQVLLGRVRTHQMELIPPIVDADEMARRRWARK
jgi:hypothetical protein